MSENGMPVESGKGGVGAGAIFGFGGLGLLAVFIFQNTEEVPVDFLFWQVTWPLWLVIILSAVLGTFVWIGLGILRRHRRRKARRQERRG